MYDLHKCPYTHLTGPSVGVLWTTQCRAHNDMAADLTAGSWVLFKGSGEANETFWLVGLIEPY